MLTRALQLGKTYIIRKNQIDPSAGFFYGLGFSLVHLSMALVWFFVKKADEEKAKEYDAQYIKDVLKFEPSLKPHTEGDFYEKDGFCTREV